MRKTIRKKLKKIKKIKSKKTSKDLRKYTKKKLKKIYGGRKNRIFAHMICNECKREYRIHVNTVETKQRFIDLEKVWICLLCGYKNGEYSYRKDKK